MAPIEKGNWKDLVNGGALQCMEAATLGMPFEVWKTRMGKFRNESTFEAFANVYKRGGVFSFWQGVSAKMVESASKGAVLLYSKEVIFDAMRSGGFGETSSGFAAGAGAGVCQTVVMGPCTFLITSVVTSQDKNASMSAKAKEVWRAQGVRGFYPGGTAIAFRQASNWASRQGLTEFVRNQLKVRVHKNENAKLSVAQEACAGIIGGALSAWNQPFEVARIQMQSAASEGKPRLNMVKTMQLVVNEHGVGGLFKGIVPRIGLGVWQTLFMVTGAKIVKEHLKW